MHLDKNHNSQLFIDILNAALENKSHAIEIKSTPDGYESYIFSGNNCILESQVRKYNGHLDFLKLVNSASSFFEEDLENEKSTTIENYDYRNQLFDVKITPKFSKGLIWKINIDLIESLPKKSKTMSLNEIGITQINLIRSIMSNKNGIVLFCGESNSGKTLTMQTSIAERLSHETDGKTCVFVNKEKRTKTLTNNIGLSDIANLVIKADADLVCAPPTKTNKNILDLLKWSETGILAISTMNASTMRDALSKLASLCENEEESEETNYWLLNKLAHQIKGIVVQKLVNKSCSKCQGAGCVHCGFKGHHKYTCISEVVQFNHPSEFLSALEATPRNQQWESMFSDALLKYKNNELNADTMEQLFGEAFHLWSEVSSQ